MKFNFRAFSLVRPFLLVGIAALIAWDITQVSWNSHQALNNLIDELHVGFIPLLLLGCTRAIYSPKDGEFITVRSMDWSDPDMSLSLWLSPRSTADKPIKRVGAGASLMPGEEALEWEPKYGSIVICNYGTATTDGMNEEGLVANALFLPEAGYGNESTRPETQKKLLAVSGWAQYVLDNYATVKEAVGKLKDEPFRLFTDDIAITLNETKRITKSIVLHLAISDAKGYSAIFQYIEDKDNPNGYVLKVYPKPEDLEVYPNPTDDVLTNSYKVLTNSLYDSQLKILEDFGKKDDEINWDSKEFSWDKMTKLVQTPDGTVEKKEMTPPMNGTQIRFIRASFYSNMLEQISEPRLRYPDGAFQNVDTGILWKEEWPYEEGIARAFSLIRNMSTPLNVKASESPFLSSTLWRTVADQKKKRYFFESSRSIYPLYVDLLKLLEGLEEEKFKKLDLYVSPKEEGGPETNLQEDQMKDGEKEKMGKIDVSTFEKVDEWFKFDPEKP